MRINDSIIKKSADIGDVTVLLDEDLGKYGVRVFSDKHGIGSWSTDAYEYTDIQIAESVFNLVLSVVVEMSPFVSELQNRLIEEMKGN